MTWIIALERAAEFRAWLEVSGFELEVRPYQVFLARTEGAVVNLYTNGKVVLAGSEDRQIDEIETFLKSIGGTEVEKVTRTYPPIDVTVTHIGTDEAGKGDYFGPLVVAGVLATPFQTQKLAEIGVRDSKLLSDASVQNLANSIRQILVTGQYDVITISPARYNALYDERFRNVNGILGWAHARAIENLLMFKEPCDIAIADQFGDQSYIVNALMKRGRTIKLIQVPKAERDVVVAAASILARAGFIDKIRELSESFGTPFPKGATHVVEFGTEFVGKHGYGALRTVAKVHFATTSRLGITVPTKGQPSGQSPDLESLSPIHRERDQDNLRLECFVLIGSFEKDFRSYIAQRLEQVFGDDWWEKAIEREVRAKVERRFQGETGQGKMLERIDLLGFEHYKWILTSKENWERVFSLDFKSKDQLVARLTILKTVRDPVSHARPLEQRDKLDVIAAIEYLRRVISQRRLEDFAHPPSGLAQGQAQSKPD